MRWFWLCLIKDEQGHLLKVVAADGGSSHVRVRQGTSRVVVSTIIVVLSHQVLVCNRQLIICKLVSFYEHFTR